MRSTFCALVAVLALACAWSQPGNTERLSVSLSGADGDQASGFDGVAICANGRFVAFASRATNLVANDTNGYVDVFVRDRLFGTTERVSVSSSGHQGDGNSAYHNRAVAISADGRFVAFASDATNLVDGDTNATRDIFVRDRLLGTTERASVSSSGTQGNGRSGNIAGPAVSISGDGRFVAFESLATNLVDGDSNGSMDVFVRDRQLGVTVLASVSSAGTQGNADSLEPWISADGRYVAFRSLATNLVLGDVNGVDDVFVRDLQLGTTELVSISTLGVQANQSCHSASFSADGRYVAFSTTATTLVPGDANGAEDVFVRDRGLNTTELVSLSSTGLQGNGASVLPTIGADGRFVSFVSSASNFATGDVNGTQDIFVRDRQLGTTDMASVATSGSEGDHQSNWGCVSADGRFVAFCSYSDNLANNDNNGTWDVFVHERVSSYHQVSGTVTFLNFTGTKPASISVHVAWKGFVFGDYDASVSPDGSYALSLPAGPLTLSTKPTHWLKRTVSPDTTGGDASAINLTLINGDATGDNSVGIADLGKVLQKWMTNDPMADLDGSGSVGLSDLSTILKNFGMSGDP